MIFADPNKRSRLTPLLHLYWRFARGMTLGVRACVIDGESRVLLVKHSYMPGWYFPGGGVEVGQTMADALATELREEANVELTAPAQLVGLYLNAHTSKRDHVALYRVEAWRQPSPPVPNAEIIAHGFFARDALPEGTTRGTRERLAEMFEGRPATPVW
ncbi:NUDIX domain-containing protein [Phreatobacter stygius]|uniref:NUDIX domain-containing protein n=1 Tax=Phreatobacter stygius TaxID=1940610 RepID=A0A4D7ARB6_9HYPH|nr:NUDIX domain-containing protein [Phreatobacter stygius]QCI63489.1 NUDIX domain-containing protein [Phreatobacter stygius]